MAKSTKALLGKGEGPNPNDRQAFSNWLAKRPHQWSVTIAVRAALRVLPLLRGPNNPEATTLSAFRATAIARFAARFPNNAIETAAVAAAAASSRDVPAAASFAATAAAAVSRDARDGPSAATAASFGVSAAAAAAFTATATAVSAMFSAVKQDAEQLHDRRLTPEQLATVPLWPKLSPRDIGGAWRELAQELRARGDHWSVWIDWYDDVLAGAPHLGNSEAQDAAYTDVVGELPWEAGAEAVNMEIARRLAELSSAAVIPDQSPAPVRVEERDGRVAKATDRDSALSATERDFRAWRDPVVDHIDELTASDFAIGTNHSRIRDRLMALGKLLPGEIVEVKERQFRIGYEIERFEGLMAAYRSGGDDMPLLNAAQLEDLDGLRVALKMGIDKLERWSEFRRQANESTAGEADADRETVGDALDEMAEVMEQGPRYFDPELPASFRFLAEAVRDRSGATKTIVYGAVKSAENVISFLGQRALGIGKKSVEAVEAHISKAIAASLVAGLSTAALGLSGALPQGWAWLKPLLAALGAGG
jgi:hypothetical protein